MSNKSYYSLENLQPVVCGNSGVILQPIDFGLILDESNISVMPILFDASPRVKKFLPTLDFSSKESIQKFVSLVSTRTEAGIQFTYGIYFNRILAGMIFVNTPVMNKVGMGLENWTVDFFVFETFEGQGVMKTALPRMMFFLQQQIGVEDFYLIVDHDNTRCIKLISLFPIDEVDNGGFRNTNVEAAPPRVFLCPLSTIRFK